MTKAFPSSDRLLNFWQSGLHWLPWLANSCHHLRVLCLFIKVGWPTVSSYLFCQHFNVHEYLECWTLISYLLHIYPRMKLAYCILLSSLFRQTCQEKIGNTSVFSGTGRPETPNLCTWKLLLRHEGLVSPSESASEKLFWNLRKEMKPISCFLQSGRSTVPTITLCNCLWDSLVGILLCG